MSLKLILLVSLFCLGNGAELGRLKRQGVGGHVGGGAAHDIGTGIISDLLNGTLDPEIDDNLCGRRHGCHRGYCWASCDATVANNEWCYTTRAHSQSFQYVRCSQDSECDKCWACAGACTV